MSQNNKISYQDGNTILEGYYAFDPSKTKQPAVLIAPDYTGRNDFACHKANQLADLGYVGFALDMYGEGKKGKTKEEKTALMQPFMQNRAMLQQRILAALKTVQKLEMVDTQKIAAMGFCFGGLCVLDLARTGAELRGVISFHGLFKAPENIPAPTIKSKILALHGFDDPMVTPDQVMAFGNEMTHAKANWELDIYGQTMHAFMNPEANDPDYGTVYNPDVEKRAWDRMKLFLSEIFA